MIVILLFTAFHLTFTFDSFVTFRHGDDEAGIYASPILNMKARFNSVRVYSIGGYTYYKYEEQEEKEWKLFQIYGKLHFKGVELKGGKSVYIPGFPGLFNPFSRKNIFNTIATQLEGDWGGFLRYSSSSFTSNIFIYRDKNSWNEEGEIQLDYGRFLLGLYGRNEKEFKKGIFGAYLGPWTVRLSFFREDNNNTLHGMVEKNIVGTIVSLHFLHANHKFLIHLPGGIFQSDFITAVEFKFPQKVFEIPYVLLIYDVTNKNTIMLYDIKIILRDYLKIEAGATLYTKPKLSGTVYIGLELLWGF